MILNFLFPHTCLSCHRPIKRGFLCPTCWKQLEFYNNQLGRCLYCQKPAVENLSHYFCKNKYALEGGVVLYRYNQVMGKIIRQLKYNSLNRGEEVFQILIDHWWKNNSLPLLNLWENSNFVIQPVPLSQNRYRWRGFNQAEVLAKLFAKKLRLKTVDYLLRHKESLPRLRLSLSERQKSIRGSYSLRSKDIKGKNFIVVDDIVTTGSTLKEISRILKRNGANQVWYLTLSSKQKDNS